MSLESQGSDDLEGACEHGPEQTTAGAKDDTG
jgi:hypothetical protein